MKLVLIGYMASGKTFISKELANKLGIKHIDLDAYIEKKESLKIKEIFKNEGEIKFRLLENKYLLNLLCSKEQFILSVGGGTPCYANNMDLILKYANSFYLRADIQTLFKRLVIEKEDRPLLSRIPNSKLREFISKHLFERSLFYNKANNSIDVNCKSIEEVASEIITLL
ncbi:MAG: shikimate kinase [Flavobacteriaceae bacterium]|nr:shikimate kinase [Flavobacteriaceae bacterium]